MATHREDVQDLREVLRELMPPIDRDALRVHLRQTFVESLNEGLRACYGEDAPQFRADDPQVVESHNRHLDLLDREITEAVLGDAHERSDDVATEEPVDRWTGTTWTLPRGEITAADVEAACREMRKLLGNIYRRAITPQERARAVCLPAPSVCDLSTDPLACAILRCWARQPWGEVHRCALIDRMIELGHEDRREAIRKLIENWAQNRVLAEIWSGQKSLPRRLMRRMLRWWKRELTNAFGRFE